MSTFQDTHSYFAVIKQMKSMKHRSIIKQHKSGAVQLETVAVLNRWALSVDLKRVAEGTEAGGRMKEEDVRELEGVVSWRRSDR